MSDCKPAEGVDTQCQHTWIPCSAGLCCPGCGGVKKGSVDDYKDYLIEKHFGGPRVKAPVAPYMDAGRSLSDIPMSEYQQVIEWMEEQLDAQEADNAL